MDGEHQAHRKSLFPLVRDVIYLFSAKNLEEIGQLASESKFHRALWLNARHRDGSPSVATELAAAADGPIQS
jgi:hypothetical protein